MTAHNFNVMDVIKHNPVFRCSNRGCKIIWWPDRSKPKSECKGQS